MHVDQIYELIMNKKEVNYGSVESKFERRTLNFEYRRYEKQVY
jgi:hypothetical protein